MLSIDEAIAFERQQAKDRRNEHYTFGIQKSKEAAEEHEQLAEWLEELKVLREEKSDFQIIAKDNYEMGMENGYNKALDDFIHECDKYCGFYSGKNKSITREDILKIAEQLKEQK